MAKILLVKCNELDTYPYCIMHPMGLMFLSACLKRDGHEVRIIDTRLKRMPAAELGAAAREFAPDVIGLSAILIEADNLHTYTPELRQAATGATIVAGGPYATSCTERLLADPAVDFAVMGEGEATFSELVAALAGGGDASGVAGLSMRDGGGAIKHTTNRDYIQDLDALPFPDRDAVDMPAYFKVRRFSNRPPGPHMPLFTSRSCPYNCIYCHKVFGKKFRARSPENVIAEISEIVERHNIRDFEIFDDCFNLDRERAMKICEMIVASRLKIKISFPNGVRGDRLDGELVHALKAAGTVLMTVAIESGEERLQKLMRKNLDFEKVRQAVRDVTRAGIFCHGFFMFGFPTETEAEMKSTMKFACESALHTASFFIVKPAPGTELHAMYFLEKGDSKPSRDSTDYAYTSFNLECSKLPEGKLQSIYRRAFLRFYFNPVRIWRILLKYPDKLFLFKSFLQLLSRLDYQEKWKRKHGTG